LSCTDCSSPSASPATTTVYTVSAQFGEECPIIVSASATVEVLSGFAINMPATITALQGESVSIEALVEPASATYSYEWQQGGNLIGTGASIEVASCFSNNYDLIVTDENGCTQSASVQLIVVDGFSIDKLNAFNLTQDSSDFYEGLEIGFSITTNPAILPGAIYEWYFDGQLLGTTTDTVFESIFAPEVEEDALFKLEVVITTAAGCQQSDSISVFILDNPVIMPSAFSPNNDSTNDLFSPISKVPINMVEFKIWNRWGQLVYDNKRGANGWDGKQNDNEAPSDVYVYFLVYEIINGVPGAQKSLKGDVTLLR
jgi:gliding motility-associated-like protein